MRRLLFLVAALGLTAWAVAFFLSLSQISSENDPLPTLMVLPSLTPTRTPSQTYTPTPTSTLLPSVTPVPTETLRPSLTPTLSQRVLEFTVILPGVWVAPTQTPFPHGTILLPAPPEPIEPLPDATESAPPLIGWYSFESDYPSVIYQPVWTPRQSPEASRGQYHRTEVDGTASFWFEGEALRVRYVAAQNMGVFEVLVDGVLLDSIDAYAESLMFPASRIYLVGRGMHRLDLRATGIQNQRSEGQVIGLDAIQVFRGNDRTVILPLVTLTSSPEPMEAVSIELVGAPPTLQPTGTPVPPRVVRAEVVIAYDENGNRKVDPAEGVAGISVRVVEINTNRVIASAFTDPRGYAAFEVVTDSPAQIVVPYFGQTWALQRGSTNAAPAYTLLLKPGNQPGLIP